MKEETRKPAKTVVLGLDGMDLKLVERWAREGRLPFLANMLATCPLVSLSTPSRVLQGAVWPSILTGVSPGRHGLYLQSQLECGTYDIVRRHAIREPLKKFYQYFSDAGLRCAVADIPTDKPAPDFLGLQIVDGATEFSFWGHATEPPELAHELESRFGKYPIPMTQKSGDSQSSHLTLKRLLEEGISYKSALAHYLLAHDELDLIFLVFMEAHKAGHWLWKYSDAEHPDYEISPPELRNGLLHCYQKLDQELQKLAELLGPNDNLLVISDHGMQANFRGNHLAESILQKMDLLVRKGGPQNSDGVLPRDRAKIAGTTKRTRLSMLRRIAPKFVKPALRNLLNLPRIDMARTQAFILPTDRNTYVRINLKGREPEGQVAPGTEYERLLDRIEGELRSLVNVATGGPAVSDVIRLREAFPGERAEDLPDISVLWSAEAPIDAVSSPSIGVISKPVRELRSGNHREEGFLLARGPGFLKGPARSSGDILQIAPTLLQLHKLDLPSQFDQEPLLSILERVSV